MSCFFVTGTDTNVGKTVASRAIIQALQNEGIQIVGYKPIACRQEDWGYQEAPNLTESDYGLENNSDVLTLMSATKESVTYQDVNSYSFSHKLPMLSEEGQRIDIAKINYDLMALSQRFQSVLVEGAFGWLTPMNQEYSFASGLFLIKCLLCLLWELRRGVLITHC